MDFLKKPHYSGDYKKNHKFYTVEKIKFQAQKNESSQETITRYGLLTLRPEAQGTVIICHGYLCNKYDIAFLRTLFPNFNSLVFDFRAHGEAAENQCCTLGKDEAFDVMGAVKFVRDHPQLSNLKLFGYGFSMGAVSLIEAQAKAPVFDALILDCPFDSSETILSQGIDRLSFSFLGYRFSMPGRELLRRYAYNPYIQPIAKYIFKRMAGMDATKVDSRLEKIHPAESVASIKVPCFFIHCKNDDRIPPRAIQTIYEKATTTPYKRLWLTQGRGHCDSFFFNPERYFEKTNRFLNSIVRQTYLIKSSTKIRDDA